MLGLEALEQVAGERPAKGDDGVVAGHVGLDDLALALWHVGASFDHDRVAFAAWLKERALQETSHIATYVLLMKGEIAGFHSLGMSEVELRTRQRQKLSASHPRQGAVLILWLARSADAEVGAEAILRHAVGIAQIGSRRVGAAVIAVDPFDAATEGYWREHFGFRASLTKKPDADGVQRSRLWLPLLPEG